MLIIIYISYRCNICSSLPVWKKGQECTQMPQHQNLLDPTFQKYQAVDADHLL